MPPGRRTTSTTSSIEHNSGRLRRTDADRPQELSRRDLRASGWSTRSWCSRQFEQQQQVRGYYSVRRRARRRPLHDRRHRPARWCSACASSTRTGCAESDKNWSNLHTVYTHGYGVIAAYGNQRDEGQRCPSPATTTRLGGDRTPAARTSSPTCTPDGYDGRDLLRRAEPRLLHRRARPRRRLRRRARPAAGHRRRRRAATTTYDGAAGVPIGGLFQQDALRVQVRRANLLLSGAGQRQLQDPLRPRPARDGREGRPVAHGRRATPSRRWSTARIVWMLDGYTTTDQYPLSASESFDDDDRRRAGRQHRVPDPADRRDQLHAQRGQGDRRRLRRHGHALRVGRERPDAQGVAEVFPGTVGAKAEIPPDLLAHMRYPEDLFKVQRYQLAPYHVTDASDFYEGNDRGRCPGPRQAGEPCSRRTGCSSTTPAPARWARRSR